MQRSQSIAVKLSIYLLAGICLLTLFSGAVVQYVSTISSDAALATVDGKLHLFSSELVLTAAQLSEKQSPSIQAELKKNLTLQIEIFERTLDSIQRREWETASWFATHPSISESITSAEDEWKNRLKPFLLTIKHLPPEEVKIRLATFYEYNKKLHKSLDALVQTLEKESHNKIANVKRAFMYMLLILVAVSALVYRAVTLSLIAPLRSLWKAVERIEGGDMAVRVAVTTDNEIGRLSQAFNQMSSALEQKFSELASQNSELAALSAASASLLSVESSDECYRTICKTAAKLFARDVVWLGLIHEGSTLIKPVAHSGITADIFPDIRVTWDRLESGNEPFGIAIRTGLPRLIEADDPALIEWKNALQISSMLIVPLSVRFRCLGVLVLCSQKQDCFQDIRVSHCRIFADNAASICENTRLIEYMITSLARAAEANDEDTGNHILRLSEYCVAIAEEMKLEPSFISRLRVHSTLHDVGKVHIPQGILKKLGKLTQEEFDIIKQHPVFGADIIGHHPMLKMSRTIAGFHHERWDGTGYPFGVKGEDIPLEARIIFLADQYDALRSKRCYKNAFDHATTCRIILEGDGRTEPAHFDPLVLEAFRRCATSLDEIFEREMDNLDVASDTDDISFTEYLWVGIAEIDEQHAELFERIKGLNSVVKGSDKRDIGKMMDFLSAYIETHFSMEEKLMEKNRYPHTEQHIAQHRQFVGKLDELQKQYYQDLSDQRLARHIINWLSHWLIRHIASIDRALASYLKEVQNNFGGTQ
jgi:hemerythrin-like metal-binding protein